jgi:hydroxypyruvate reductase
MGLALERHWPGELTGLIVTRYGHSAPYTRIEVIEAAHPVPDEAGRAAAARVLALVQGLTEDGLVLALISGGGSSLLALPAEGLTLGDKQAVNRALLRSGASIDEMNCVRKHLSAIKGGRLAAAAFPARPVSLVISDVPGDDTAAIIARYGIELAPQLRDHLRGAAAETPKPGDPRLARSEVRLIAVPQLSLQAAAGAARDAGVTPVLLGDALEGESRELGKVMAGIARSVRRHGQPATAPAVLLSGGETRSRSAARAGAAGTSSTCWRWPWRWTARPRSG